MPTDCQQPLILPALADNLKPDWQPLFHSGSERFQVWRGAPRIGELWLAAGARQSRRRAGKALYLAVSRYDRAQDASGQLQRVHQEDFCQALGLPRRLKYQEDSGPGLGDCATLLRKVTRSSALQVRQLLRWQLFNVLSGNCDGHAKNLSLCAVPGR